MDRLHCHTPCLDLEFCLSEHHNFLRKGDDSCFFSPIAYTLVARALLAGEKCRAQSHCNEKGVWVSPSHYRVNSELLGRVFFVFSVQADPLFTSM